MVNLFLFAEALLGVMDFCNAVNKFAPKIQTTQNATLSAAVVYECIAPSSNGSRISMEKCSSPSTI